MISAFFFASHCDRAYFAMDTKADTQAELVDKFRMRLLNPFNKTFIKEDDERRITLTIPGSSNGNVRFEKRDATLPQGKLI